MNCGISYEFSTVPGKLPARKIAPSPNSNANPKPNPDPDWGAIFLGGNFPDTVSYIYLIYLFIKTKVIIVFILLKETFVEIIFENLRLSKMLVKGAAVDGYCKE